MTLDVRFATALSKEIRRQRRTQDANKFHLIRRTIWKQK